MKKIVVENKKMKNGRRFALILSAVFVILFASIAFTALDILTMKNDAADDALAVEYTYSAGTVGGQSSSSFLFGLYSNTNGTASTGYETVSLGGYTLFRRYKYVKITNGKNNYYHKKDPYYKNYNLTLSGVYGLLGRNGWIVFNAKQSGDSPYHDDNDWYMGVTTNVTDTSVQRWGGPGSHEIFRRTNNNGNSGAQSQTYRFRFGADDGTYWAFGTKHYNTDSNIEGWVDIYVVNDTAKPVLRVNRVDAVITNGNENLTNKYQGTGTDQPATSASTGYARKKVIYLSATDSQSGINPWSVSVSGGTGWTLNSNSANHASYISGRNMLGTDGKGIKITCTANTTINVSIRDNAGRRVTKAVTISGIDTAGPSLSTVYRTYTSATAYGTTSYWTNQKVGVYVTATDAAGVASLTVGGTAAATAVANPKSVEHVVSTNTSGIAITTYDSAANKATGTASVANIDKTAPTHNSSSLSLTSGWTNGNVTLTVKFTDSASKIWRIRVYDNLGYDQSVYQSNSNRQKLPSQTSGYAALYTATFTLSNYRTYYIEATDHAGNTTKASSVTPKIDKNAPTVGSNISLTGTKWNSTTAIDAKSDYVFSNVTVKLNNPGDAAVANASGISGLARAELYYANSSGAVNGLISTVTPSSSTFTFTNAITYNSVEKPYGYLVRVYDVAGNYATSPVLYPKKDDTMPVFDSITGDTTAWSKSNATIAVTAKHGQSGILIYKSRSTISTAGAITHTPDATAFKTVSKDSVTISAQSSTVKTARGTTNYYATVSSSFTVGTQGLEYYYFRLETGAGYKSYWYGRDIAAANYIKQGGAAVSYSAHPTEATFSANNFTGLGVRTMIDTTAPQVKLVGYTYNSASVANSEVESSTKYYKNPVTSVWEINDGLSYNTLGINGSGGRLDSYSVTYSVYYQNASGTKYYTYINDGGATTNYPSGNASSIVNSYSAGLTWNSARKFGNGTTVLGANQYTVAAFTLASMYNFVIKYTGEPIVPTYEIRVKDTAGNETVVTKKLYIDTFSPRYETPVASPYVWGQWTNQSINIRIAKTFGQSGSKFYYYFDPIRPDNTYAITSFGQVPTSGWKELSSTPDSNGISGSNNPYSLEATMNINAVSRVGKLWFWLVSGAGKDLTQNTPYEIKIDNTPPVSLGYEFRDAHGAIIPDGTWSSTLVKLIVFTSDGNGAGVRKVTATLGTTTYDLAATEENIWATSGAILDSGVYKIKIYDNVPINNGNASTYNENNPAEKRLYETHSPLIDTVTPQMTVTANNNYDSKKGTVSGTQYHPATPERVQITLSIQTSAIKSGARLYMLERDLTTTVGVTSYIANRYNINNLNLEGQGWVLYHSVGAATPAANASTTKTVGLQNSTVHKGYDFVIVSGSGLMAYVDYGGVFVDMETPSFDSAKSLYALDNGATATGVLPDANGNGLWTNSKVSAKLYIGDASGSGIKSVTVTKGAGSPVDITNNFQYEKVNGLYLTSLFKTINSVKISRTGVGEIIVPAASYSVHNVGSVSQIRFSSAYDIRPDDFVIVNYVNQSNSQKTDQGPPVLVSDENTYGNGFYLVDFDDSSTYLITYTDNAGNSTYISRSPMIDRTSPGITINATAGGSTYRLNPSEAVFTTQSVVMNVTLTYGLSAFPYKESEKGSIAYQKGRELYVFEISLNGRDYTRILPGTATVDEATLPGVKFEFVSQNATQAVYRITFSTDRKQQYSFRVQNGVSSISTAPTSPKTTATPLTATNEELKPYIKVDKTAPALSSITYNVDQSRWTGLNWYFANISATVRFAGNDIGDIDNIIGSGLNKVTMYKYKANDTSTLIETIVFSGSLLNTENARQGRFDFTFDGYYTYRFEAVDNMGNTTVSSYITANIDKAQATLGALVARLTDNRVYTPGTWTALGMTFSVSGSANLSGFRIQYSTSTDNISFTNWTDLTNGVVNPHAYTLPATHIATLTIPYSANQNQIYRFRLINKAGLDALNAGMTENNLPANTFALQTFGRVQIDSVVPYFTQIVAREGGSKVYVQDTWTASDLIFTMNIIRGASGSDVAVSINGTDYYTDNDQIGAIVNPASASPTMTLNKNIDGNTYYFKVTSKAGLSSVFTRTVDGVSIANWGVVKIDKNTPNVQPAEFKVVRPSDVVYVGGFIDYAATWDKGTTYSPGNWSPYFVMARVQILSVGRSEGYLQYSDEIGAQGRIYKDGPLSQTDFLLKGWMYNGVPIYGKELSAGTNVAYMLLQENQNRQYSFRATSYAGLSKEVVVSAGNIRMDMDKPFMTVQTEAAQKSKKWTSDATNDIHKWYISNVTLKFTQARYSGASIVHTENISGSRVYYTAYYMNGGSKVTVTDWTEVAKQAGVLRLTLGHNADRPLTYEFKIVSGAGLECYLTEDYAGVSAPSTPDYPWLKNLSGDINGSYTLKIDTNDYAINVQQWLKEYRDLNYNLILSGVNLNEMAAITVSVNGETVNNPAEYQSQTNTVYYAKRGDAVELRFEANAYDALKGYGYIYKRAEYSGTVLSGDTYQVIPVNNPVSVPGESESSGSVSFDICDADNTVKVYFTKEISLAYQGLTHELQYGSPDDPNRKATVTSPHAVAQLRYVVYYNGIGYVPYGTPETYTNTTTAPRKVGSYALTAAIENDNPTDPNYRLHNPTGQYFVIRYFANNSSDSIPRYTINNPKDLTYIDIYNNSSSAFNFLEANHAIATYVQAQSFTVDASFRPISGVFTGTYNGAHYDIIVGELSVTGDFGIFNAVSGTVQALGVRIGKLIVNNGGNVGFVTGSLIDGGRVDGCFAIGEIEAAGTNANIGGLIGQINEGYVLTCYSNVNFSNKGKALSGNIGGLVGLVMGSTSRLFKNFALGPMEIYNVPTDNLKAATLAGQIVSAEMEQYFQGNKFLLNNLFINEEILSYTYGVAGMGASVSAAMTTNRIEGLGFTRFVTSSTQQGENIAIIPISPTPTGAPSSRQVTNLTIDRIREQGMAQGVGTAANPFIVTSLAGLEFIDKYPWAHYSQAADIVATSGFNTIAAHKVFTGSYDGKRDSVEYKISNITINSTDNVIGIFGKVAGTIKNLYISNLEINVNYAGSLDVLVGGVTANIIAGASLEAVSVVGNITVTAPNATVYVGGIAGKVEGASILDILNIANIKVEKTLSAHSGGTVGWIKDSSFRKVFSLARVEVSYRSTGSVGAIAGSIYGTTTANMSEFYAIRGNTYKNGQDTNEIVGYAPGSAIVDFSTYMKDFSFFRNGQHVLSNGTNIENTLITLYPFAEGKGTTESPFQISSIEEFMYINDFLYAHYHVRTDLDFTGINFKTIGMGAKFTGSIDGSLSFSEQTENDGVRTRRLTNLNNALVYFNAGTISNLRIHTVYSLIASSDVVFGAVAIYNNGTLQNLVVEGDITIMALGTRSVVVGGMVGQSLGGSISGESTVVSSMTGTNITVSAAEVSIGGVVGEIKATTTLNYLVSNGSISGYGLVVNAGTIAGAIYDGSTINQNEIAASAVIYINGIDTYTLDEFENKVYQQFGFYFA